MDVQTLSSEGCPLSAAILNEVFPLASPINCRRTLDDSLFFSFQLKTQLTETLSKLETEENERQKVAGDLYKVILDFIALFIRSSDLEATLITRVLFLFNPGPAVS